MALQGLGTALMGLQMAVCTLALPHAHAHTHGALQVGVAGVDSCGRIQSVASLQNQACEEDGVASIRPEMNIQSH